MCPTTTPKELRCITIIKELVKERPFLVHSEFLLGEENLAAYLPPIGHTIHSSRGISIHPPVALLKKSSPSLSLKGKGKKPHAKATKADSDPTSLLGQLARVVSIQQSRPMMPVKSSIPQLSPIDPTCGPTKGTSFGLSMPTVPLLSVALVIEPVVFANSDLPVVLVGP